MLKQRLPSSFSFMRLLFLSMSSPRLYPYPFTPSSPSFLSLFNSIPKTIPQISFHKHISKPKAQVFFSFSSTKTSPTMASASLITASATIRASASSSRPNNTTKSSPPSSSGNWWTPLFGWSQDPEYIENSNNSNKSTSDTDLEVSRSNSKFVPGAFTAEKAKQLRIKTTGSFHDIMYHSAIASRLASNHVSMNEK